MEYLWCILAALGAGIGTGLAGLSAATVMVPILFVMCPSFSGETGAYQATAIALMSDILGSLVTTITYARNKKIDLKRGSVMLACIVTMCTVGSYVAYLAGNVVLGGFTLILTFCIGIRFLVKPDTERKNAVEKGAKLGLKEIILSVFFGVTIGFGTGFVGTGGGMMMLIIFTVFFGMELKTAVGTSTFIMTFTALIASVSHVLIHPAIILERYDFVIISVAVCTLASLISARFANRASNRTVGIVTGVVLTFLGAAMIYLNYREFFTTNAIVIATFHTFVRFVIYIASLAIILIISYLLFNIPQNVFRKLLHMVAFTATVFVVATGEGWIAETLTFLIFAMMVYPILKLAENLKGYKKLFVEKEDGEVRSSLILLAVTQCGLLAVTGLLGKPYILIAATTAWGFGDIAAAWVGRPLGKHKIKIPFADYKKSWEGSIAMAIVSFIACFVSLVITGPFSIPFAIAVSVVVAVVSAFTEMVSKGGVDTVTVPLANAIILWILSLL